MMTSIKVVQILYPDFYKNPNGQIKVELIVSRRNGPALEAKKVVIPVGTTMDLDPDFWQADLTPALGVSVSDGVGTKDRFGG